MEMEMEMILFLPRTVHARTYLKPPFCRESKTDVGQEEDGEDGGEGEEAVVCEKHREVLVDGGGR
jgi:hypothetical protein